MYVRLAFAVAAHLDPEILLVDEVLAVGDAEFQKKCLGKMGEVARGGRTVFLVSHNMGAIRALCSRTILLHHGTLIADDHADRVISVYLEQQDNRSADWRGSYRVDTKVLKRQKAPIKVSDIRCFANSSNDGGTIATWKPLKLRIYYETKEYRGEPFAIVVDFNDPFSRRLLRCSSSIMDSNLGTFARHGYIDLVIPKFPFTGGRYYLDVHFALPGTWITRNEHVVQIDVEPTDVFGAGCVLDQARTFLAIEHHWEHHTLG